MIDAPWRIVALFSAAEPEGESIQLLIEHTYLIGVETYQL